MKEKVKEGIAIVIGIIVIIAMVVSIEVGTNKAIEQCVANGQTKEVCESGLR